MVYTQGHTMGRANAGDAACAVMSARWAEQCCGVVACALMSAHKAAQCIAEAACAITSQHLAQQSQCNQTPQFEFRYQ